MLKELKLSVSLPIELENYLNLVKKVVAGIIKGAIEELAIPCEVEVKKVNDDGMDLMIEVRILE